jgi:hypothetical protein
VLGPVLSGTEFDVLGAVLSGAEFEVLGAVLSGAEFDVLGAVLLGTLLDELEAATEDDGAVAAEVDATEVDAVDCGIDEVGGASSN